MNRLIFVHVVSSLVIAVPASLWLTPSRLILTVGLTLLVGVVASAAVIKGRDIAPERLFAAYSFSLFLTAGWLVTLGWITRGDERRGVAEVLLALLLFVVYRHWTLYALHVASSPKQP